MSNRTFNFGHCVDRPGFADLPAMPESPRAIWASPVGFDVAEPKFDGIWGKVVISAAGRLEIWTRNGSLVHERQLGSVPFAEEFGGCVLHGEFLHGSAWGQDLGLSGTCWLFDCTELNGHSIEAWPLKSRRAAARNILILALRDVLTESGVSMFDMAPQYDIGMAPQLWRDVVLAGGFEGLVFKDSAARFGAGWTRMKRSVEVDYVCLGFVVDPERGAVSIRGGLTQDDDGVVEVCTVGNLPAARRKEFTAHPERFVGLVFKARGARVFRSGALRNPKFAGWHGDKQPAACTLASALQAGCSGVCR